MRLIDYESMDENVTPDQIDASLADLPYEKITIRKPIPPKLAKVRHFKQVGDRTWATVYRIRDDSAKICYTVEKYHPAVKLAKELAIKNIKNYYITIDKTLINADPRVSVVTPGKHKKGKFKFTILDHGV